jgi:hypothetical protein
MKAPRPTRRELTWFVEMRLAELAASPADVDLGPFRRCVEVVRGCMPKASGVLAHLVDQLEHAIGERAEKQARARRVLGDAS